MRRLALVAAVAAVTVVSMKPAYAEVADTSFTGFYANHYCLGETACVSGAVVSAAGVAATAVGAGLVTVATGGVASPAVLAAGGYIGSLGGLHGAAATSYGLALMGGGSLASGGFGVAGGTAVLSAVFAAGGAVKSALLTQAVAAWFDQRQEPGTAIAMPIPTVASAPEDFSSAVKAANAARVPASALAVTQPDEIEKLRKRIVANRKQVEAALLLTESAANASRSVKQRKVVHTGRALWALELGDISKAKAESRAAIGAALAVDVAKDDDRAFVARAFGPEKNVHRLAIGVPAAVWAITAVADPAVDVDLAFSAFRSVLDAESNSELLPQFVAAFLDHAMLNASRRDRLLIIERVYRAVLEGNSPKKYAIIEILSGRVMVWLFLSKDFTISASDGSLQVHLAGRGEEWVKDRLQAIRADYRGLVELALRIHEALQDRSGVEKKHHEERGKLIDAYRQFNPADVKYQPKRDI